jgi:hypothetical protein
MTISTEFARFVRRTLWYLAILGAITLVASHRFGQHPSFVYQGF